MSYFTKLIFISSMILSLSACAYNADFMRNYNDRSTIYDNNGNKVGTIRGR